MYKYLLSTLTVLTLIALTAFQYKPMKIIFFGDSITEMGVQPGGYISKLRQLAVPVSEFDLVGKGIGGNKVYDLYLRLENDVLSQSPDVVFIYVGINDIWHKRLAGTGTDADKFEKFYRALIKKMKDKNISVVLCTPAVIGERTDNSNEQDGELNYYSGIIRKLSRENDLPIVDLRKDFSEYLKQDNPQNLEKGILTTDRVHLNEEGNKLVADSMWKVIQSLKK